MQHKPLDILLRLHGDTSQDTLLIEVLHALYNEIVRLEAIVEAQEAPVDAIARHDVGTATVGFSEWTEA